MDCRCENGKPPALFLETGDPVPIELEGCCEVGARPRPRAARANAGEASGAGIDECCDGICVAVAPMGSADTFDLDGPPLLLA